GRWEDFAMFDGTFRNFRDQPGSRRKQQFVRDIEAAVAADAAVWKAPSWDLFVHACRQQGPLSLVSARDHTTEPMKAGVRTLVTLGFLPREPNDHTIFPVGNDAVRRGLGDARLEWTTPVLKKAAIIRSVEFGLKSHGPAAPHRFGMSDDDPLN